MEFSFARKKPFNPNGLSIKNKALHSQASRHQKARVGYAPPVVSALVKSALPLAAIVPFQVYATGSGAPVSPGLPVAP